MAEQDETAHLRAEVSRLKAERAPGAGRPRSRYWRGPLSITLIILGCVLAPVAVVGFWASNEVTNTDRYVEDMAPLIAEPAVQSALTDKISAAITGSLDISARASQAATELSQHDLPRLSAALQGLSGPLSSAVDSFVHTAVGRSVASPAMATIWTDANRAAHAALVKVLSGQGNGTVQLTDGKVQISLGPFIKQAEQDLTARGLSLASKLPDVNPTFTLFAAPNLAKAQAAYRFVDTLHWALPVLSVVLLAAGVLVAMRRRRALIGTGLGLAAGMLVLGAGLAIARTIYLRSVPSSALPADAAAATYDDLVRFVRQGLRALLVVGLVLAMGAYLTGPVGAWVGAHKTGLRTGVVALAAVIFVFSIPPTVGLVIWLVAMLLVLLALIELLGGTGRLRAAHAAPSAAPAGTTAPAGRAADTPGQDAQPQPGPAFRKKE